MTGWQPAYDPFDEGIYGRPPTLCIKCGHSGFKTINPKGKNSARHMCKKCNKSYYVPHPEVVERAVQTDGFIADNAVIGMSIVF